MFRPSPIQKIFKGGSVKIGCRIPNMSSSYYRYQPSRSGNPKTVGGENDRIKGTIKFSKTTRT